MTVAAPADYAVLGRAAGLALDEYRPEHIAERVRRALERERGESVDELARVLRFDPMAREAFRRSVAVSVFGLFRDPEQFELLERELLPRLLADGRRLTVWSAGCSDGTELYTTAVLLDRLGALERSFLLGSDVLEENLELARACCGAHAELVARARGRVQWERRDLIRDGPPPGKWRLVLCRNAMIYFNEAAKRNVRETLVSALASNGVLLLGRSERLPEPGALGLEPVAPRAYRKVA